LNTTYKRLSILFIILFLLPFLVFLGVSFLLVEQRFYPILYQFSITLSLGIALYYFLKVDRKWKGWIGWFFLVLSLIFLFVGDTIWNFYAIFLNQEAPFPGISDIFYALFYLLAFIFLTYFIRLLRIELNPSEKFMIIIISLVFLGLLIQQVVLPILVSNTHWLEKTLNVFYLLGDFILLVLAFVLMIQFWGGKVAKSYAYFILGISACTIADIVFSYIFGNYGISNWVDIFYLLSFLLLSFSVIIESMLYINK